MIQSIYTRLIFSTLVVLILGCQNSYFKDDLSHILGTKKVGVESFTAKDEFGGFGEGYTLEKYKLSKVTIDDFESIQSKRLPVKEGGWQRYGWNKTPIDSSFKAVIFTPLSYYNGSKKLETELRQVKKSLERSDVYYAFYYKPDKLYPQSVQLFILDVKSKELYAIDIAI